LYLHTAEHGVVHAPASAAAVFNSQVGVTVQDVIQPGQVGAVVLEQTLTEAIRVELGPLQGIDVVVHLDISNVIVVHKSCDYLIEVRPYFWVAEIKQKPGILQHSFAMAHEEPRIWLLSQQGFCPSNLRFEPHSRNHAGL